jgi:hypothetical protein
MFWRLYPVTYSQVRSLSMLVSIFISFSGFISILKFLGIKNIVFFGPSVPSEPDTQ